MLVLFTEMFNNKTMCAFIQALMYVVLLSWGTPRVIDIFDVVKRSSCLSVNQFI